MNTLEKYIPLGLKSLNKKELWELYDSLGTEIHNRGLEEEFLKEALETIEKSETYEEFEEKAKQTKYLSKLSKENRQDFWTDFWEGKQDEATENRVDDFRMEESDFVK